MKRKIANFNSFMKNRLNEMEETDNQFAMSMDSYSEAPEEDMEEMDEDPDLDMEEGEDEEELTMEDLKAVVDDLEERLSALEGGEDEEEEDEDEEEEEDEDEEVEEDEEEEEEEI